MKESAALNFLLLPAWRGLEVKDGFGLSRARHGIASLSSLCCNRHIAA